MSNKHKQNAPYKPYNDDLIGIETQDIVEKVLTPYEIELVNVRKECIKLSHSAAKSVTEILNDAETYTKWVLTGEKPEQT